MAEDMTSREPGAVQQQTGGQGGQHKTAAAGSGHEKQRQEDALLPAVDVVEDAGGITLYADLPGVPRENLGLHLESDSLTIDGTVALDVPQAMQSSHVEVRLPRYRRVFTLSKELDGAQAQAELKNGVLTLRIPKAQQAQPRRIEVKVI